MARLILFIASTAAVLTAPLAALAQDGLVATPAATSAATPVGMPALSDFEIAPAPGDSRSVTARGYFVYELAAGGEAAGSVRVSNPGTAPVTVELAVVDAQTAQTGGSAFASAEATPSAVANWVHLDTPRVTLAPHDAVSVGFSVRLPLETKPGQYLAGLAAYVPAAVKQSALTGTNQAGAAITMQTRRVIGIQVDVPGKWTPSLTITGASALEQPSGTKLGIAMRNDGDELLKPKGTVTLTDAAGREVLNTPIELGTFVTGTEITYPIAWPEGPRAGDYAVAVELNYADNKVAHYNGTLNVSANAPAARPEASEVKQPAVAPQLAPFPIPLWIFTVIIVLLALIAVLLILVVAAMVRGERHRGRW